MFAKFLQRPALAIVISVLILFLRRAVDQDPADLPVPLRRSPPSVVVTVAYPSAASAGWCWSTSVLVILEQAINGVPDMRHMAPAATKLPARPRS